MISLFSTYNKVIIWIWIDDETQNPRRDKKMWRMVKIKNNLLSNPDIFLSSFYLTLILYTSDFSVRKILWDIYMIFNWGDDTNAVAPPGLRQVRPGVPENFELTLDKKDYLVTQNLNKFYSRESNNMTATYKLMLILCANWHITVKYYGTNNT